MNEITHTSQEAVTHDNSPKILAELRTDVREIKRLLLEKSNEQHHPESDLLTISQAADFLHLSKATIYTKISIKKRELPFMKRGGRVYFSRAELLQFLKDGRRYTHQEIQEQAKHSLSKKKK